MNRLLSKETLWGCVGGGVKQIIVNWNLINFCLWNPEYKEHLLVESGILGFGIRVDSSRNQDSRLGSGIQVPVTKNSVS